MIDVREGHPHDVADLIALDSVAIHSADRRRAIAHWLEAGQCWVALRMGQLVGYVVLTREFFHSYFVELLMVTEPHRRGGIGARLLEHCAGHLPAGEKLWTSTNESNLPMRALLESAGFIRSGIVENLDEGDPELIFVRLP